MKFFSREKEASTAEIAFWYLVSNIFAKGMAMVSTPIFTRLMSKDEYGQFSNFTSWESIITVIVTLNLMSSIARAKYDFEGKMNEYLSSVLAFSNLVTLGVYLLVEIHRVFFQDLFSMDIRYIRMLFLYLLFAPAFSYLQVKHRIYRKYKFFVAFSISSAIIRTVVSVLLVVFSEDKFWGRICGYLIPVTLFNMVLWITVMAEGKKVSLTSIKYACRISVPLIPHALSGIVLGSSDRIMITNYCGSEATALYSLAYTISQFANLLWTSMNQAWAPWLYDNMHANNKQEIRKKSKLYLGVFVALVIGIFLITPEMILILGGRQYYASRYVMPPVIVGFAFQFIYGMYVNIEIYEKKTFTISIGTTAAAALNIFLNWLFIPKYGYMAAAYTTMVGYFALLVFHYVIVKKTAKEYADIYEDRFIFGMILLVIAIGAVSLLVYQYNILRYGMIAVYAVCLLIGLYKNRERVKNQLTKIS
jgi:O-antigen/teichoic acid export membrane protein